VITKFARREFELITKLSELDIYQDHQIKPASCSILNKLPVVCWQRLILYYFSILL